MPDRRRTRQLLLFLGNVASGVVTVVVIFFGVVWAEDIRSFVPLLLILVAVPALATRGWRTELERRGREPRPGNARGVAGVPGPHRLGGSRHRSCGNLNVLRLLRHGACTSFSQNQHADRPHGDFRRCWLAPLVHLGEVAPDARPAVADS
jgi:hypothetical protein